MRGRKEIVARTWDEFWGPLLMIRCHRGNAARWTKRQERADWIFKTLNLDSGDRVLDLGCGDGLLDICLARLGAKVTAVDRISSVLKEAAAEPNAELVDFVSGDFREMTFAHASFDLILMLDLIGLLSREDDTRIIGNVADWIRPRGWLIIDFPVKPEESETNIELEIDGGSLHVRSTYNEPTRRLHIKPQFHEPGGRIIELVDNYAGSKQEQAGIVRYIYPRKELSEILRRAGFEIEESRHDRSRGLHTIVARKP